MTLGAKDVSLILKGEVYRLITPAFLHAGVVQLVITLVWQIRFGRAIEMRLGWWRTALIYLSGALGGMFFSSLMLPTDASVGSAAAMMAMFGCSIAELVMMGRAASRTDEEKSVMIF